MENRKRKFSIYVHDSFRAPNLLLSPLGSLVERLDHKSQASVDRFATLPRLRVILRTEMFIQRRRFMGKL